MFSRVPLRLRVALAFALTTVVALSGFGVFVQLRVTATLEERLEDTLEAQLAQLLAVPAGQRVDAVERVIGETFAQLLTADGQVVASSGRLPGVPVIGPTDTNLDGAYVERAVTLLDRDEPGSGPNGDVADQRVEEAAVLLIRADGDRHLVVGTLREDTDQAIEQVRSQLLVGGPIALVIAALLGYVVAGTGLRPIELMRARAATISDRSAGERLPVPTARDELQRLATTLNDMLDRLDDGLRRERRFVAEASHELRTPLALLRMELDLALARPRSAAELEVAVRSASEETERLIALAEDLLTLAAADRDGVVVETEYVDLSALVAEVARRFSPAAADQQRSLTVHVDKGIDVHADPSRLGQVVSNLLDNALRHGTGSVVLRASRTSDAVVLSVGDEGPGPDPGVAFRPFVRGAGGRGLGLAIVDAIVRAHHGTIVVVPRTRAVGHDIVITLPFGTEDVHHDHAPPAHS